MLMNLNELKISANALGSYFSVGVPPEEIMGDLAVLQEDYAGHWEGARQSVAAGNLISASLVDVWPPALVSAVKAGEKAGKMDGVLSHIVHSLDVQTKVDDALKKLRYPTGVGVMAFALVFWIMAFVAPKNARALRAEDANLVTQTAMVLEKVVQNFGFAILATVLAAGYMFVKWVRTPAGKDAALDFLLQVPYLNVALVHLYFGLWSDTLSMILEAGIPMPEGLRLTAPVLPQSLRPGVLALASDLVDRNISVQDGVKLTKMKEGDPRLTWPKLVRHAFIVGDRTGTFDSQLRKVGGVLVDEGVRRMVAVAQMAEVLVYAVGGSAIGLAFIGVYSPIVAKF